MAAGGAGYDLEDGCGGSSLLAEKEVYTPDYAQQLLERLHEFKDDKLFCDFTLKVENQSFNVHKAVLAGCSDYFRAMFSHGMIESRQDSVELQSVSASGVRALVDYAYTGKMMLSLDFIPDILSAATFLQITPAIDMCAKYMKENMTFDNAEALVALANNYGIITLARYYKNIILENFFEFADTETFLKLDAKTLASYLLEDSLRTPSEGQLLKKVLSWYDYDKTRKESDVYNVMEKIRYTLDGWPTIEYASQCEPFLTNKKCKELIEWSQKFLQQASRKHLCRSHRTRVRYDRRTLVQIGGIYGSEIIAFKDGHDRFGVGRNHYYHHDLNAWFPLGVNSTTESRSHCPMVEVNNYGILCGGFVYMSDFERTYRHFSNEVKLFIPAGFALWDLTYMQEERAYHTVVHASPSNKSHGHIYVVGGMNEKGPLQTVEKFYMDKERWRFVCSLDKPLFSHAAAAYQNKMYVSGGVEEGVVINRVQIYDPQEDSWTDGTPMLCARSGHTVSVVADQLIVCGGRPSLDTPRCLASVEAFDLEIKQWSYLTPMRQDCCNMTPVVYEDGLLIVGGESSVGDLLDQIQEYRPSTGKWGLFSTLPFPLSNTSCCALTIKLSKDGQEETDSLVEAYNASGFQENGLSSYLFDCSDDSGEDYVEPDDVEEWRFFVDRNHWPLY